MYGLPLRVDCRDVNAYWIVENRPTKRLKEMEIVKVLSYHKKIWPDNSIQSLCIIFVRIVLRR